LIQLGFQHFKVDYSLFTKKSFEAFIALLVYVDDVLIASDTTQAVVGLKILWINSLSSKT